MMKFALDTQIASQPASLREVLKLRQVPTLDASRPLIFAGIGTSWHACRVAARWLFELSGGQIHPTVLNAHDLALTAPISAQDQVIVVSHRGSKTFPRMALTRARQQGATTVVITSIDAPEQDADYVIRTCPGERSSTHTVSYTTALAALAQLVAQIVGAAGSQLSAELERVPDYIEQILAQPAPIELAQRLATCEPLLLTGVGRDAITAAEAALKFKEGSYTWAEGMETENALHGPPAVLRAGMGAIVITPAGEDGQRTQMLLHALQTLGVITLTCGDAHEDLWFPSMHPLVRPLVSIVPLQRMVAELARIKGSNPDNLHRELEPWTTVIDTIVL
jgi:glucosamine--fructose-6-phosphate aminotransferase (isomerizing)